MPDDVCFKWRGVYVDVMRHSGRGTWTLYVAGVRIAWDLPNKRAALDEFSRWAQRHETGEVLVLSESGE